MYQDTPPTPPANVVALAMKWTDTMEMDVDTSYELAARGMMAAKKKIALPIL